MGEYLFIGSAILSLANGTVLLCINPRRVVNKAFFACSICIVAWCVCVVMAKETGSKYPRDDVSLFFWLRASSSVGAFLVWFLWLTRSVLLEERRDMRGVLKQSWPWFCISSLIAVLPFLESFISSDSTPENTTRGLGYAFYAASIAACCFWLLIDSVHQARRLTGARKIEMQFFVIAGLCACLLVILCNAISVITAASWFRQSSPIWFSIFHGLTVWAICYYRVFDAKQILAAIGQRLVLVGVGASIAVLLYHILVHFLPILGSLFIATLTSCLLTIAADGPMRKWWGLDRSFRLLEPRRKIIKWARELPEEDKLTAAFEDLLREWCQTNSVILISAQNDALQSRLLSLPLNYLALAPLSKDGWITPEALQRSKSSKGTNECAEFMHQYKLGAMLAVPKGGPSPSLVIALGQKESLRPYTFPDIQILLELTELMDNILAHTRAAARATQIQKMDTAVMISRGLAHDLGNLATPVSSFLVHMENRVVDGTPEALVLADAKHSIGVMQNYIQESLFFTRTLALKVEAIAARQLLLSVSRLCRDRARKLGVDIVVESGNGFVFRADPALSQRLLQNLVFNALDASPRGSKIELRASPAGDGRTVLKVCDQGTGIAPEIFDRIFEPYFTTKHSGRTPRGLGLGLAICRKIVDLHGGGIWVESRVNHGTEFTVILPTEPANRAEQPALHAENHPNGPTPRWPEPLLI